MSASHVAWGDKPKQSSTLLKHGTRLKKLDGDGQDRPPTPHVIRARLVKNNKNDTKQSFSTFSVLPAIGDERRKSTGILKSKLGFKSGGDTSRSVDSSSVEEAVRQALLGPEPLNVKRSNSMRVETAAMKGKNKKLAPVVLPELNASSQHKTKTNVEFLAKA